MRVSILFITFLFSIATLHAQVRGVERRIVSAVDEHRTEAEDLLKRSVNINSGTMNFEGVREVGRLFMEEFNALGFETQWLEGEGFNRSGHLVASHSGKSGKPKIMLIGHLDTVFEPDHPNQTYRQEGDSILHGPGVVDMKGGDVIIIYALRALREAGVLDDMNIRVVMTGDEEKSGSPLRLSKKALTDAAEWADFAIGFENGDSKFGTAVISRRGSISWKLEVTGNPAHSSQVFSPSVGAGAIYEASRILHMFYEELSDEPLLTFNPGVILGGSAVDYEEGSDGGSSQGKKNVVAQKAVVSGDLRAVSAGQQEMAIKTMQRIASENLPGTAATLSFEEGYPPLAPSEANRALLELYSNVSQDLGYGPVEAVDPLRAGAADVSFTAGLVDAAMDGIGLSGGNDHTAKEFGELDRLDDLTRRAALFLYRLHNKK